MRILKVVQSYYPFQEKGGTAVKVHALARGLARRGHQVTVLTADLGLRERDGHSTQIERCEWGYRTSEDGVEAVYLPVLARYRALTLNSHVIDFCRDSLNEFDVVHIYGLYDLFGPAVSHFCRQSHVPYVVEPMGMYRPIDRGFFLKAIWHRLLGRQLFLTAARIVATSEMEQEELIKAGLPSTKVALRYNGVDSDWSATLPAKGTFRSKWAIQSEERLILFLSRLIPRKRADMLIEAFATVCSGGGRLVIAGPEGERGYRAYLERCAAQFGVKSRVLFTGPLYDQDKRAAMADADLFVLPSSYENFANAAAEAMACGVPVLITDSCGIRSLVVNRAGLVVKPDKAALIDGLQRLMGDAELYSRFKRGCSEAARELGWERLCAQMETLYASAATTQNRETDMVVSALNAPS